MLGSVYADSGRPHPRALLQSPAFKIDCENALTADSLSPPVGGQQNWRAWARCWFTVIVTPNRGKPWGGLFVFLWALT